MKDMIENGARQMGISLPSGAADQLIRYHEMLLEANRVMNLTRVSPDARESVDRNYLDSLSPLSVPGLMKDVRTLVDIGTGAGFPGVPLAIACPHIHVVMMDALGKRIAFINEVISALHLNAEAVHIRAEDAARLPAYRDRFDLVTARAVAALPTLIELMMPFARPGGRALTYKGPSLEEELAASGEALRRLRSEVCGRYATPIPSRDWDHRLLLLRKTAPTPAAFPRKAGEAGRNPLRG